MVARLVAVTAVVVITGAPVVRTACEGMCAARASDPGTAAGHHACHHEASTPNEPAITSAAHLCGHSEEGPSGVGQPQWWSLASPAVIVETFALAPPSLDAPLSRGSSQHGPPLVSPRSTQLRI
jgi:hypothetical protein